MIVRLTGLVVLGASVLTGQTRPSSTEQQIIGLEHRWEQALLKQDRATLEQLLDPSYTGTDEDGVQDKAASIATVTSGEMTYRTLSSHDLRVRVFGNTAVVIGIAEQAGSYKGQPLPPKLRFTDTWIQQGGTWRIVASHDSVMK